MQDNILTVESLSLTIHDKTILNKISLEAKRGELWSFIGPNGAGKSSLLKCLMRIHDNWTGRILLSGHPISELSQRALARRIAYVPQAGDNQSFAYTVREFVRMGRFAWEGPFGTEHAGDNAAIERAMERTGTTRFADRTLDTLSGGERQKVFIAAALAQETEILLLDEPTAFLDYQHQNDVAEIISKLNRESHTTILNVTHDVNAAVLAGGHVLALCDGKVAWTGMAHELTNSTVLSHIFSTKFRLLDDPVTGSHLVIPERERISA